MGAGAWAVHDTVIYEMATGNVDTDTDVFKIILCSSSSNEATTSVVALASLTNQLATANGYTQNDKTLTVTDSQVSGTYTFDSDNAVWTASGGPITARYAVIYDDTHPSDLIIAHVLLDDTPADVTATDGNTFTVTMNASGIFTVS